MNYTEIIRIFAKNTEVVASNQIKKWQEIEPGTEGAVISLEPEGDLRTTDVINVRFSNGTTMNRMKPEELRLNSNKG